MAALDEHQSQEPAPQETPSEVVGEGPAAEGVVSLPLPLGLQEIKLTEADAVEIRRILDDPNYPTHAGCDMKTADASSLRTRKG